MAALQGFQIRAARRLSTPITGLPVGVLLGGELAIRRRSTHDRTGQPELPLTHEFLAMMLGVRRAGVTEGLQGLQQLGLVRCGRGEITLLDRQGVEAQACECYGVVAAAYTRILG